MSSQKSSPRFRFTGAALLLSVLVFLIPALHSGSPILYLLAVLVPCVLFLSCTAIARMFSLDRMLLAVSLYLCAMGVAALAPADPNAALSQALRCGIGLFVLLIGGILIRSLSPSLLTAACMSLLGLLLLVGKMLSPSLTLSLTEGALALLLIAFASLFARQGSVPAALLGFVVMVLLLIRGETDTALLWGLSVLLLVFAADGRPVIFLPTLAVMVLLFFGAYQIYAVPTAVPDTSVLAVLIPAGATGSDTLSAEITSLNTVSLFPRLTGHYGLIFSGLSILMFLPFSLRGASVASSARTRFHAILAMGITLMLALRTLAAALAAFGFSPFHAPAVPFLTSSAPDLCSQLFLVGLLCGISGRSDADLAEDAHLAMLAK